MIRHAEISDLDPICDAVVASGLFGPDEIAPVRAMLAGHLEGGSGDGARTVVDAGDPGITGLAHYGRRAVTDGVWEVTILAVPQRAQGTGIGKALLAWLEDDVRRSSGRMIVIETSGSAGQERARGLYARAGYEQVARIADYWEVGDDLVMFVKRL